MTDSSFHIDAGELRGLLDSFEEVGIAKVDRHGRVIFWSRGAEIVSGYSAAEMVGQPATAINALFANPNSNFLPDLTQHDLSHWFAEPWFETRGGKVFRGVLIVTAARRHGGYGIRFRNISDVRQRWSLEDNALTRQMSALLSATAMVTWVADKEGNFVDLFEHSSDGGIKQSTLSREAWILRVHPDDLPRFHEQKWEAIARSKPVIIPMRGYRDDGDLRNWEVVFAPVRGVDGDVEAWVGLVRDTTESELDKAKLREGESIFRQFAENMREGIWICDAIENKMLYVNEALAQILGRTTEDLRSDAKSVVDMLDTITQGKLNSEFQRLRKGEAISAITSVARADQSRRWVSLRGYPMSDESGLQVRTVGIIDDITQELELERRLQDQREEMRHASRLTSIGMMTMAVSHEISQPLSAIANQAAACLQLLASPTPELAAIAKLINKTVEQTHRAGAIVARLRGFGKKAAQKEDRCDVASRVRMAIEVLQPDLAAKGVSVEAVIPNSLPFIWGDPMQLEQVFINLMSNAADALAEAPKKQRDIRITCTSTASNVVIAFEDGGKGVSEQIIDHLFEPFVTDKSQGLGLGLSICREIVLEHYGRIEYAPRDGGGSRFTVTLPISARDCTASNLSARSPDSSG